MKEGEGESTGKGGRGGKGRIGGRGRPWRRPGKVEGEEKRSKRRKRCTVGKMTLMLGIKFCLDLEL